MGEDKRKQVNPMGTPTRLGFFRSRASPASSPKTTTGNKKSASSPTSITSSPTSSSSSSPSNNKDSTDNNTTSMLVTTNDTTPTTEEMELALEHSWLDGDEDIENELGSLNNARGAAAAAAAVNSDTDEVQSVDTERRRNGPSYDSDAAPGLSSRENSPNHNNGSSRVSFAKNTSGSDRSNFSSASSNFNHNTSVTELLAELGRLQAEVSKAKVDFSAEKVLRKKKERNMVKLAKQLNIRTQSIEEKEQEIDQLLTTQASLEQRLAATRKELEELTTTQEKASRDHHAEWTEAQNKQREMTREFDEKLAAIQKDNAKQCQDLRRQILSTSLEADRLRMRLAKFEMAGNPNNMDQVVQRTLRASMKSLQVNKSRRFTFFVAVLLFPICLAMYVHFSDYAKNVMCMPCAPGTELTETESLSCEAPWWASQEYKADAHLLFCGNYRKRTRLTWTPGTQGYMGNFLVHDVTSRSNDENDAAALLDKRATRATVFAEYIDGVRLNKIEHIRDAFLPWTQDLN